MAACDLGVKRATAANDSVAVVTVGDCVKALGSEGVSPPPQATNRLQSATTAEITFIILKTLLLQKMDGKLSVIYFYMAKIDQNAPLAI